MCKYWTIVAFNHPSQGKSVLYRQKITINGLLRAIEKAIEEGANLMSLRGFEDV